MLSEEVATATMPNNVSGPNKKSLNMRDKSTCREDSNEASDSVSSTPVAVGDGDLIGRRLRVEAERKISDCLTLSAVIDGLTECDWSNVVWRNVFYIGLYHVLGSIGFYQMFTCCHWYTIGFFTLYHLGAGLGVTAGLHRLWSHKSYKASTPLQLFLAFWATAAFENSIYVWSRDHRVHHKYSETEADPHNAQNGLFFAHIGWLLKKKHPEVTNKGKDIDMSDLKENTIVMWQHRYYVPLMIMAAIVIPSIIPWLCWGESLWVGYCVALARVMFTHHCTWFVNSIAHWQGDHPYDATIWPVENLFVAIFALGEGWHNYHHSFPNDYRTSDREEGLWKPLLNFTHFFIDTCSTLGLAGNCIKAPTSLVRKVMSEYGNGYSHQHHNASTTNTNNSDKCYKKD